MASEKGHSQERNVFGCSLPQFTLLQSIRSLMHSMYKQSWRASCNMLSRPVEILPENLPPSLPSALYHNSLTSSKANNRLFCSKNSSRYQTYHSNRLSDNWLFMLGLALTGSALGSSYLDSQIAAAAKLYPKHFFCAECGKLNGTKKKNVTYERTNCCHCKASLVLYDANYYEAKQGAIASISYIDKTGVFSGIVLVGDGLASADAASIAQGCLSLATLGLSKSLNGKDFKEVVVGFQKTQNIGSFIRAIGGKLVKFPPDDEKSAYQLYDDLTDEEFEQIVNSIDCVSTSNTVDTKLVRAMIMSPLCVTASFFTVPYDIGKGTIALLGGGLDTLVYGGNYAKNCDDLMDDMGGCTTKELWVAAQDIVHKG